MAPAATEVLRGEPFVGRDGTVLRKVLRKVGQCEEFAIWNTIQCRGPNDQLHGEWVEPAIAHCAPHRDRYSKQFHPSVTVALGAVPFRALTGSSIPITKARGYRYETEKGPVIPTYHPSFLGRGKMNLMPVVIWDIQRALEECGQPPPQWPVADLMLYPTPSDFSEWCQEALSSSFIAFDLETEDSHGDEEDLESQSSIIVRASLATDKFKAITFPWQEPFIAGFAQLMSHEIDKVGWNSDDFDLPRLRAIGIYPAGRLIDGMWMWNFLQKTLPRGLGHVTTYYDRVPEWKSLGSAGSEQELYSAMDARETAKCWVGIWGALEKRHV